MTEFALVLPMLMVIVVGMLAFGRVFFYWIDANHLANETARWAAVDRNPYDTATPPQTLQQHVLASGTLEFQDARVCLDFPDGPDGNPTTADGESVRVRVQKPFDFLPILGIGKITIRGSSTMRIERLEGTDTAGNYVPANYTAGSLNGACT